MIASQIKKVQHPSLRGNEPDVVLFGDWSYNSDYVKVLISEIGLNVAFHSTGASFSKRTKNYSKEILCPF
jgi:hypothetical protein